MTEYVSESRRLLLAEARIKELESRLAVLYERLADRAESIPNLLPKFYRENELPAFSGEGEAPVDLVLTVRDTYDFLVPCVESIFANTDVPFHLFINDNVSSDPRTPAYLRQLREAHPDRVSVFFQKENLGVPGALNFLMRKTSHDVIQINADTVMPPGWASRLLWPIRHSGEKVGSSSPFSTAAAMGSFPCVRAENDLLPNLDTAGMDAVFRTVKPTTRWKMHFSPGFCMVMSRAALDEVGLFDAETYNPGYGEETDWCLRASKLGYKHVLAANLFVYHKHSVTFKRESSAGRDKLLADHIAILESRYPGVMDKNHDFNDGLEYLAFSSFLLFLAGCASGGGLAVRFVPLETLRRNPGDAAAPVLRVAQDPETGEYHLRFSYMEHRAAFTSPNLNWVIKAVYRVKVREITVDELPPRDQAMARRALSRMGGHFGVTPRGKDGDEIHEA